MKECNTCNQLKQPQEFYPRYSKCKLCCKAEWQHKTVSTKLMSKPRLNSIPTANTSRNNKFTCIKCGKGSLKSQERVDTLGIGDTLEVYCNPCYKLAIS